jgi:O-antigen/teichoic acid export membrane protein
LIASVSIFETGLFSLYVYRRYSYEGHDLRFNKDTYKYSRNIVTNGWPLLVALQLEMVCQKIYGVMLPAFMSPLDYGHFMFAFRLLEISLAVFFVASVSFFPNLSELKNISKDYLNKTLSFYMEISLLVGVISWIFIILAYEPMAYVFFGEKFLGAGKYLYILWAIFFIQSLAFCRADYLILNASSNILLIGNSLSLIILLLVRLLLPDWFSFYFIEILLFSTFVTFIGSNIVSRESRNYLKMQLKAFRFYHCSNFLRRRLNEY